MTQQTNDKSANTPLLTIGYAILEIDSQIRSKTAHLKQLTEQSKSRRASHYIVGHGPLSINPNLRPIPPPTPSVLRGVCKRLYHFRRRTQSFRHAYISHMKDIKEKAKAKQRKQQESQSTQDHLLREHRELTLLGDIHGISVASSSKHSIERQLRMLRRGGTVQAPGNNDASRVAQNLGKRRSMKKLAQCRAHVDEYVPKAVGVDVQLDAMSRRMEDPMKEYYDACVINPWTLSERTLFVKLFILIGKDFANIAQHFTFKSTQDVIRFYYEQKLTFRLKQMRERYLKGQVITDEEIVMVSSIGTVSVNMLWSFEKEGGGGDQVGVDGSTDPEADKSVRHMQEDGNRQSNSPGRLKKENDHRYAVVKENEENLGFLSNTMNKQRLATCPVPMEDPIDSGYAPSITVKGCSPSKYKPIKMQ